jgi:DNA invertase Pin-like site-specific DNA recombinase
MADVGAWVIYIRRSAKRATSADVSDETQEAAARAVLPPGATVAVIRDSGGHQSGATTDRDGYQELLAGIRAGRVAGIAVYDLSRLHRNIRNMLDLSAELERRRIPLLVATMPTASFDGANGRFLFGQLALAAQWQRDMDSDRAVRLNRSIFEAGGHRGLDPFGYRTIPGSRPRTLEVVEHEADVVRRIWRELASRPTAEIADGLNRDGVRHRADRPWTRDAVKDIVRRGRLYLGLVTEGRGPTAETRPGRHPAIIDQATYRDGLAGAEQRVRGRVRRSTRHRVYLLAGVLTCAGCGHRMHGQASLSRGREWRYYRCRHCPAGAVPAETVEAELRDTLRTGVLPDAVIDRTRERLRERLALPSDAGRARRALETRRDRNAQLFEWGHRDEATYRSTLADIERELALLPSGDRLALFDRNRSLMVGLATSVDRATPDQLRELVGMLVAAAELRDGSLSLDWTGPARPFFAPRAAVGMAPPDGSDPPLPQAVAWYLEEAA